MNIIVQAGGRGSRLRHLTWNRPKCLVPVYGEPMLLKLFKKFKNIPNVKFYVIGDYGYDVLDNYLKINAKDYDYKLVKALGKGTISGINQAMGYIPDGEGFLLIWSDIIVNDIPPLEYFKNNTVFMTNEFACRWSVDQNSSPTRLVEKLSRSTGVPGVFYFENKSNLSLLPDQGEFVKWLSTSGLSFDYKLWTGLQEVGELAHLEDKNKEFSFSRFFNNVEVLDDKVIKQCTVDGYEKLIDGEIQWYKKVRSLGFERVPEILEEKPLVMSRIKGSHAFELEGLSNREKKAVIADMIDTLKELHKKSRVDYIESDYNEVYKNKTVSRVLSISSLINHFDNKTIVVNGKKCLNLFYGDYDKNFDDILKQIGYRKFALIHGDPTFSNTIIDDYLRTWFIDPRGYFAKEGVHGDPMYDYAKVFYSAVGGYDLINRKQFKIYIDEETVEIIYEKPQFHDCAIEVFEKEFSVEDFHKIKIIHALIWFSLSGYASDDIDTMLAAFYLGTYWMNEAIG